MARNPPWTRDELVLALDLYLPERRVPEETEREVVQLSRTLNVLPIHPQRGHGNFRSPDAVVMKLANFRSLDPTSTSAGLGGGGRLDAEIWDRFAGDRGALRREVRRILAPRRFWLKLVYNTERLTGAEVWRNRPWVSDAHVLRGETPTRRPGYSVGDQLVIYDVEFQRCPARLQVTAGPIYDPARVEREGGSRDATRWGWLTEVRALATLDVTVGPKLQQLRIDPMSIRQKDHLALEPWQYAEAVNLLPGEGTQRPPTGRRRRNAPAVESIPIEAMNVEATEVSQERQTGRSADASSVSSLPTRTTWRRRDVPSRAGSSTLARVAGGSTATCSRRIGGISSRPRRRRTAERSGWRWASSLTMHGASTARSTGRLCFLHGPVPT